MYVPLRFPDSGRRFIVGLLLATVLFFNSVGTLFAGTTGSIAGTITNADTKLPLAGVTVNAVSPTGRFNVTTNAQGFYAINGISPDTYTVSFELKGFTPASFTGINIFADQTQTVSTALQKSLQTIGKVTARAVAGAFQPNQTQDTYTVTTKQITEILGKADAISETNLLTRLPGASLDKYGYPVLRGGRENEEGFQFDGIDYVDAFTSQFTNSLALNPAVGQLQLTPGAGDASVGNAGTGTINLIAKRGAYPGFGSLDAEALLQPYSHQLAAEYGFSNPSGSFSNYFSFLGSNNDSQYGVRGGKASDIGAFYTPSVVQSRSVLDNLVFKFGKNKNQSFQILYDNQQTNFGGTYGGNDGQTYPNGSKFFLNNASFFTGLTVAQLQSPDLIGVNNFQTSLTQPLTNGANNYFQPNNVIKFQYTNNLSASTFLTAKYYQLDSTVDFNFPYDSNSLIFSSFDALQGGHRTGTALDVSSQLNSKNLLSFGGRYDFLHPVYDQQSANDGLFAISGFNAGFELADFINPFNANPDLANCPLDGPGTAPAASACGYLYQPANLAKLGGKPGPIPYNSEQTVSNRQDFALYLRDKFTPNDKLNIDAGIRIDGAHYRLPGLDGCNPTTAAQALVDTCQYYPTGFTKAGLPFVKVTNEQTSPVIFQPRLALSYKLGSSDAVRASYGRSVEFAPLAFIDVTDPAGHYSRYANIPSYDAFTGLPATFCGVLGNLPCTSYADQLHWENQNFLQGVPIQPVKPETFTNYEFSYEHQFANNISFKITPFYRRGYDALVLVAQPRTNPTTGQPVLDPQTGNIQFGPPQATNLGTSRTTGLEFYLTRSVAYGLSGQLAATYINEFTNVVPSPLIQEDFFPPVPTQSLALGNQYRVGFVSPFAGSLALSYKMHSGLRVNPIVTYSRGYPIGVGNITAAYVNNVPVNIPNTNTSQGAAFGSNFAPNYVDPQNPGTVFRPNIAATRGSPESASAGGVISHPRINTDLGVEFNKPGSKSTVGVLFTNLFNQIYGRNPAYNSRYQPVATGISGPKTGTSALPLLYPNNGFTQYTKAQFGQDPYRLVPSATPQTVRVYYQLAL